jgi:hypothetical protein
MAVYGIVETDDGRYSGGVPSSGRKPARKAERGFVMTKANDEMVVLIAKAGSTERFTGAALSHERLSFEALLSTFRRRPEDWADGASRILQRLCSAPYLAAKFNALVRQVADASR